MKNFLQIVQLIPALIDLIKQIETVVPQGGQGSAKLAAVRGIMEATYDGVTDIWPALEKVITTLINLFNSTGLFKKG
jgi:phage-related protein